MLTVNAPAALVIELTNVNVSFLVWLVIPALPNSTGRKYVMRLFPASWPKEPIIMIVKPRYRSALVRKSGR